MNKREHSRKLFPNLSLKFSSGFRYFKKLITNKFFWLPLFLIIVSLAILVSIPSTRYRLIGEFWHQKYVVRVVSLNNNQPIIGAKVTIGSATSYTNNEGIASLEVLVGHKTISITRQYFASIKKTILIPLSVSSTAIYKIKATGIFVPLKVINAITKTPIESVTILSDGSKVETNKFGHAIIVLPANIKTVSAHLNSYGFNSKSVTIHISSQTLSANTFSLTPIGTVYFLSNNTGNINVDSVNLDGTDQQTLLKGTGNESLYGTQLLPSDNSQYLALLANRNGSESHLYVINTSNDSINEVNPKATRYRIFGWTPDGHLIYKIYNNNMPIWMSGTEDLMTYNASSGISSILAASKGIGTSSSNFANQNFQNIILLSNNKILYSSVWRGTNNLMVTNLPSQSTIPQQTMNIVDSNSLNSHVLLSVPADDCYGFNVMLVGLIKVVVSLYNEANQNTSYYIYNNAQLSSINKQNYNSYLNSSQTPYGQFRYLVSPNNNKVLVSKYINGHNAIFTESINGGSKQQIAILNTTYNIYGWVTNNYVLVSKNNNELYVMPASGANNQNDLIKVTNYLE